jgi:hypothetical protein
MEHCLMIGRRRIVIDGKQAVYRLMVVSLATLLMNLWSMLPLKAQVDILPRFRAKVGIFLPQNSSLKNLVGDNWFKVGADIDVPLFPGIIGSKSRIGVEWTQNGRSNILPITLTQVWQPSTAVRSPVYFGGGVGLWTARFIGSGTASRFGFRLVGGVEFSEKFFGEVEYDFVDKVGGIRADGLSILVGTKL